MKYPPLPSLLAWLALATTSLAQNVVPMGAGSYASFPPAAEGAAVANVTTQALYLVNTNTVPVPSNQWWTDLLVSKYVGNLWAHPLVVSADAQGANVFYPTNWNATGNDFVLEKPLRVRGKVTPNPPATSTLLADFEAATYPAGWTTTGTAFGTGPATNTLPGQSQVNGWLDNGYASSFHGGDGPTGTLTSTSFTINRQYLHFMLGGGNHPGTACLNLIVNSQVARTASASNSETFTWQRWDLANLQGQSAKLQLVDQETGGWGHIMADQLVASDDPGNPAAQYTTQFSPADARALNWSDWLVTFRLAQTTNQFFDVTVGHGLPYVWVESTGVTPQLIADTAATAFDNNQSAVTFPFTGDHFGLTYGGRHYGVFAPAGTTFTRAGDTITAGSNTAWVVIGALPNPGDLATFHQHAPAIPRNTQFSWTYDPVSATVTTRWQITTQSLAGNEHDTIQGWLPHHYRSTTPALPFNGFTYPTVRGQLKCTTGSDFTIVYPFTGLLPNLPAPRALGLAHDFSLARMTNYLADVAGMNGYGGDTYWGGKDLVRLGQAMGMAQALGDTGRFTTFRDKLKTALTDWYTYTPGEPEHYFAAYDKWGALVGFNSSYGSEQFNDHHFHYGYFTYATAMLGLFDPQFVADQAPMATLVAKEYANWDRNDHRFPFLRTFDPWLGHSFAGGFSSGNGNNQESSSEAMQSWGGLFLLGSALADDQMRAAGAMGYAIESQAIREYWFNAFGDNWSPQYAHTVVGILFGGAQAYATYFSGDPGWIHGIQWLPCSPLMRYLVRDPAFARQDYQHMLTERLAQEGSNTISSMGGSLGNVALGYELQFDPTNVVAELDDLWTANDPVVHDTGNSFSTYYFAHANRCLGPIAEPFHMSLPTSAVYRNGNAWSYVVYNFTAASQTVTVYSNQTAVGQITAPPRALTVTTNLVPIVTPPKPSAQLELDGNDVHVRLLTSSSWAYQLEFADALPATNWQMQGSLTPGTGSEIILDHIGGAAVPQRFYRVHITDAVP